MTVYLNKNISVFEEIVCNETKSLIFQGMESDSYVNVSCGILKLHFVDSSSIDEEVTDLESSREMNINSVIQFNNEKKDGSKKVIVAVTVSSFLGLIAVIFLILRKKHVNIIETQKDMYYAQHFIDEPSLCEDNSNFDDSFSSTKSEEFEKKKYDLYITAEEDDGVHIQSLENSNEDLPPVSSSCGACRIEALWQREQPVFVPVARAPMFPLKHKHYFRGNCGDKYSNTVAF